MTATDSNARDIIALTLVAGAGRKVIHTALQVAGRLGVPLRSLFGLPVAELVTRAAAAESDIAAPLHACGAKEAEVAGWILGLSEQHGFRLWTCQSSDYPGYLSKALGYQAPPLLFYQGNEALVAAQGAAIVGTRRPSLEGRAWAVAAARLFAREGVTVVSGGAAGIDLEAHQAVLKADGTTIVVLPEGLHAYQPPPAIQRGLENGQVLLVSEFLPVNAWQTHRAMTRNRTIAASVRSVCVIEPGAKGGSMFTAEESLALGRPVFYWGGACRDGALRGRHLALPLVRSGRLDGARLRASVLAGERVRGEQTDLFSG